MSGTNLDESQLQHLQELSRLLRHWILRCSTAADSGHPTSSLSAVELMATLFFGDHFRFDVDQPDHPNNDRLIFSKGHASPLLYALWTAADQISPQELMTYRQFGSPLEGHPTSRFRLAEAATGSLGQGLSIGLGMALAGKHLDRLDYRTFVLLGDSEMAEGSQWEAIQLAAHYELDNLVGILDVNRLGQRGETMLGHDLSSYQRRLDAFGWQTVVVDDGHDHQRIAAAYDQAARSQGKPTMIIAWTIKGKGVSFLAGADGWHGKTLDEAKLKQALGEIGDVDTSLRGQIAKPDTAATGATRADDGAAKKADRSELKYELGKQVATRDAYGNAIKRLADRFPELVVLDGEVCNSTRAEYFRDAYPERFFEMYIAEQNMAGAATGLALCGKLPFASSFAAFWTRAFDQIRMSRYSDANVKIVGSHCGVAVGQDGPSQMGLEDLAMFRAIQDSVVLYPCDAVSTERLVEALAVHQGLGYLRTTRGDTDVIYDNDMEFTIGGSRVLRSSDDDQATIVAAGVTLHEALQAHQQLEKESIAVRVIDAYSIKPIDQSTIQQAAQQTGVIVTVEDHFPEGGLADAVRACLSEDPVPVHSLAVRQRPMSGKPEELLEDQRLSARAIVAAVKRAIQTAQKPEMRSGVS